MADFASVMQQVDDPVMLQQLQQKQHKQPEQLEQQHKQPEQQQQKHDDRQEQPPPSDTGPDKQRDLKLYKARWVILAVYMMYSMANAVHWIQYSIISNITAKFYDVSNFAIDTTSTIYMIVYVPLVVPASWVLDRLVSVKSCQVPSASFR